MKFSRLFQPRNPVFWLMLTVNVLSFLLLFIAQTRPLNTLGTFLVGGFALGNALLGIFLARRLTGAETRKD
jgi:hypothetical protein